MPPTDSNNEKPSILKKTRESKGLTLEIVHEATKIPMDALRAIEEGYSVRILSPFYYRGFIKIYAEFLGLDVADIFKQYGLDQPAKPTSSATVSVKTSRVKEPAGPNLFLETLQEWVSFLFKPKTLTLILKVAGFLLLLFVLIKMAGCVASHLMHKKDMHPQRQEVYVPQDRATESDNDSTETKPSVQTSEVKHEAVVVPSEDDKVELAVRATRNTWIQVKADGHVVFQMTLSKGSMESWSADKTIELSGKNIERLDLEVNGKHIGSLGGGERRIRKVVITQEGLTVKK